MLIIMNGGIALIALLLSLGYDIVSSFTLIGIFEAVVVAIFAIVIFQKMQNKEVEQLEYAIFLNRNQVDALSDYSKKQLLILLNRLFSSGLNHKKQFKKYFSELNQKKPNIPIMKKCMKIIDPENKIEYGIGTN